MNKFLYVVEMISGLMFVALAFIALLVSVSSLPSLIFVAVCVIAVCNGGLHLALRLRTA